MISDIFSSFDPTNIISSSYLRGLFTWIISLFIWVTFIIPLWAPHSLMIVLFNLLKTYIYNQTKRTIGGNITSFPLTITRLFILLIIINITGLIPYVFRQTTHLVFTLSLAAPIWLSLIISAIFKSPLAWLSRLLPEGAPSPLNPFLSLVESLSIATRPITLSIRIVANISAGHIVLCLLGIYVAASWFTLSWLLLLLILIQIGYIIFEIGVAVVQSYIFCLLLSLYSNDHPS